MASLIRPLFLGFLAAGAVAYYQADDLALELDPQSLPFSEYLPVTLTPAESRPGCLDPDKSPPGTYSDDFCGAEGISLFSIGRVSGETMLVGQQGKTPVMLWEKAVDAPDAPLAAIKACLENGEQARSCREMLRQGAYQAALNALDSKGGECNRALRERIEQLSQVLPRQRGETDSLQSLLVLDLPECDDPPQP